MARQVKLFKTIAEGLPDFELRDISPTLQDPFPDRTDQAFIRDNEFQREIFLPRAERYQLDRDNIEFALASGAGQAEHLR